MIRPDQPTFADEEAFRFRHLLIRDAAYDALPKETRAELHERFADWLDRHAALVEQDEIVGYHLERAHRNRAELDSADPTARRPRPAGRDAARTPRRAAPLARGDISAMCGLVQRAAALLPEGDPQRLELIVRPRCSTRDRRSRGRSARRGRASSGLPRRALPGVRAAWPTAMIDVRRGRLIAERAEGNLAAARGIFASRRRRRRWPGLNSSRPAFTGWRSCRCRPRPPPLRARPMPVRRGTSLLAESLRSWSEMHCPSARPPLTKPFPPRRRCWRRRKAWVLVRMPSAAVGKLLAMQGDMEAARELVRAGIENIRESGQLVEAAASAQTAAFVELRAGAAPPRRPLLRDGIAELDRLGNRELPRNDRADARRRPRDARRTRGGGALVRRGARDAERRRPRRRHRRRFAGGFLAAVAGSNAEGERSPAARSRLAATIDMYEWNGRAHTSGTPARSRSSASRSRHARPLRPRSRSTRPRATSRRPRGRASCSTRSPPDPRSG